MMKQFLVNTVNKCNEMTIMNLKMMMIIFSIGEGKNMYFFHKNVHDYDVFIFIYGIFLSNIVFILYYQMLV